MLVLEGKDDADYVKAHYVGVRGKAPVGRLGKTW